MYEWKAVTHASKAFFIYLNKAFVAHVANRDNWSVGATHQRD